jgi:hypothetical protein
MKTIVKIKEHKKKKRLIKDIIKDFNEMGEGTVKTDRIKDFKEESSNIDDIPKIPETNDLLLNKSEDIDYYFNDTVEYVRYPGRRRKIFKNLTKELKIIKKKRLQLKDINKIS